MPCAQRERPTGSGMLIRQARIVPVGGVPAPPEVADIRIVDGVVTDVGSGLVPARDERIADAAGRWAIPGLWDQHVHLVQWALALTRVDLSGTAAPSEVTDIVARHIAGLSPDRAGALITGFGYRLAAWSAQPTVRALDAVSAGHAVVLISGDAHNGWLSSRALELLGVPSRDTVLDELDWFPVYARLGSLPGVAEDVDEAYALAVERASGRGIVGVGDMEFGPGFRDWPERFGRGVTSLRARVATYPDTLEDVITAGLRSGQPLPGGGGLLTMGPLKIISDGSLNTRTAYCFEPFADSAGLELPRGKQNYSPTELARLLRRATEHGLTVAVHAIGDAAVACALDAIEQAGARGSIEHAQLMRPGEISRMARLGVIASVQPAHLLDDRDVTSTCWPDRADRCFPLRSMLDAGVRLAMGSDAPVAPLDPWLAMAAAVHRSADDREAWNPAEALTAAEALAASTDGQTTVGPGSRGDVVLLDEDPLRPLAGSAAVAANLAGMSVAATYVGGCASYERL